MSKYRALVEQWHPVDEKEDERIQALTKAGITEIPDRKMKHFPEGKLVTWMPERNIAPFLEAGYIEEVP